MNIGIEAYTTLLEVLLLAYFYHRMMDASLPSCRVVAGVYGGYYVALFFGSLYLPMLPRMILLGSFVFVCYLRILKQPGLKTFYVLIIYYILAAMADLLSGAILTVIGISMQECLGIGAGRFLYNTTSKILHLLLLVLYATVTKRRYDPRALRHAVPLILCNAGSFFIMSAQFNSFIASKQYTPFIVSTLAVLLINIVICIYTESEKHYFELQERQRLMEQQLAYQEKYYQDSIARQEESRALWHDIKKYALAMETLVSANRSEEADRQLDSLKENLNSMEPMVHTGSQMADGILNYGMKKAHDAHVKMELDLWIDPELSFSPTDFYIILGNTMDNAIEACSAISSDDASATVASEKAAVHITLRQQNHILFYEITNPIPPTPVKKAGSIHGYGLENVKECVRRNQGSISIQAENGIFCVSVTMRVD